MSSQVHLSWRWLRIKNEYQLLNKEKIQVTIKFVNWITKIKKISINASYLCPNTKVWFWVWIQVEPDLKSKFLNGPLRSPRPATTNFHWSSQRFCPPPTDADVIPINIWLEFLRKTKEEDKRERSAEGVLKRERERFVAAQVREKSLTLTVNSRFLLKLTCFFFFFYFLNFFLLNCCPDSSNCRTTCTDSESEITNI